VTILETQLLLPVACSWITDDFCKGSAKELQKRPKLNREGKRRRNRSYEMSQAKSLPF
jgi:hypothetical protein